VHWLTNFTNKMSRRPQVPQQNLSNSKQNSSLSGNTLKMRFMQRGKEAELREQLRQEREKMLKESQWVVNTDATHNLILMDDTSLIKTHLGRRSFGQFNKDIEHLHQEEIKRQRTAHEKSHQNKPKMDKNSQEQEEDQADISAAEMANQFISNIKRKSAIIPEREQKRQKTETTTKTTENYTQVD